MRCELHCRQIDEATDGELEVHKEEKSDKHGPEQKGGILLICDLGTLALFLEALENEPH